MGGKAGMEKTGHRIRLYTYQTDVVMEAIRRDGVCFSKEAYVRKKYEESAGIFTTAYSWFVKEAEKIVLKPEGAEYPYWAFKDLYRVDQSGTGNMMALDIPLDEVVLFDLYDWNQIICMRYLGENEEDEKEFRQMLAACGLKETDIMLTNFYPDWKQKILQSWSRLFCKDEQIRAGKLDGVGGVQAGLWRIREEWIVRDKDR